MNLFSLKSNNISICNGKITINGKTISFGDIPDKEINIICEGNAGNIEVDVCNQVTVKGSAKEITTASGDINCGNVDGDVQTTSGDVECGDVGGDVNSVSGDVDAKIIKGGVSTISGDIN